jgi:hypothetical protein
MQSLQDALESVIEEELNPYRLGALVIRKKLKGLGIRVTDEQLVEIEESLRDGNLDSLRLSFADNQIEIDDPIAREAFEQSQTLDLGDAAHELEELVEQVNQGLVEVMPGLVEQLSALYLEELRRTAPKTLKASRQERKEFEARLAADWHEPLDLLEMFLGILK